VIGQALASRQPKRAGAAGEAVGRAPPEMIGQSAGMQQVYKAVGRVAATNATVLIRGESGTGKELVVQAIHQHSRRCRGPLVVVNCVAIPETLLESELFGYERGAFTGANTSRVGRFEQADGGTLLLDEIGDMPPGIQAKLLRVLQERTFERIGANERRWVDVRVLAATNRDLERGMAEGRFREDLYHRLNVVTIQLPALRERREDIPALVQHFLGRAARELGLEVPPLSKEAQRQLWEYDWPGNVRELDHCLQRILIWSRDRAIQGEDVRRALTPRPERPPDDEEELLRAVVQKFIARHAGAAAHERMLEWVDRLMVLEALRQTHGNQSRAARLLGLPRPTLHAHIDKYKAPAPS
jgi:DNA-binding NtrC family response regulator